MREKNQKGGINLNYGYQNERDFVDLFHDRYLSELDDNSQKFLKELFGDVIDNSELIQCWKNRMTQKTDFFIKYKNYVKCISLKSGKSNSVHSEAIQDFKQYLIKLDVPYYIIEYYMSYHYGYQRDETGHPDYSKPLSAEEYKQLYQPEIDQFNQYINQTRIIVDMIDRFLVRGKNSDYDIDALVYGTVSDYVWILKYDLYDLILNNRREDLTSPHVACMTIGPKKRNLYGSSSHDKDRYLISVRWNFILENIISFRQGK